MKVVVLGAGLVGGPMAIDLAKESRFEVTVADVREEALEKLRGAHPGISTKQQDLSDPAAVSSLVSGYDWVINAVPGFMGYRTVRAIIEAGKNVVDIAFFPEDPFSLDALAREKGVIAVVDCGVAPGMSNILCGYVNTVLDETTSMLIYVGGLPTVRRWPYEYGAVFSPIDVIEEYTRPARYVENGTMVVRPALSDPELIDFPGVGTLEAFNTDGLRSLAETLDVPNMKEKTLRYPGHIDKMAVFRETGFFSEEEIDIGGSKIRPIDFTARLLFPKWKMEEGEADITVMQVAVEGKRGGKGERHVYDLLDRYDESTRTRSMARTTGYTATVVLRMLSEGLYSETGITVPEYIGRHARCVDFILRGLKERGIAYDHRVEAID